MPKLKRRKKFFTASVALYYALYPTPKINRRRNVKNREVPKFCSAEILYIYSTPEMAQVRAFHIIMAYASC